MDLGALGPTSTQRGRAAAALLVRLDVVQDIRNGDVERLLRQIEPAKQAFSTSRDRIRGTPIEVPMLSAARRP